MGNLGAIYGYPICELDTRRPSFVTTKEFRRGTASTNTQPSKHALQPAGTPGLFSFMSNWAVCSQSTAKRKPATARKEEQLLGGALFCFLWRCRLEQRIIVMRKVSG